ncbi:MAG: CopD family protein [Herbaspirillum sp.]
MLWIKSLHLVFIISWFSGLFYLPRIFVNLAEVSDVATTERLILMARRLYRFMSLLALPAIGLGLWLWLVDGIGKGPGNGWLHAKLLLVLLVIGYHLVCGSLLKAFEMNRNRRSSKWLRWFNEIPVILLLMIVLLVILKPF